MGMLQVEKQKEGKTLIMSLIGKLDTVTAPQLKETIDDSLLDADKLILDFQELEYTSSAGLRVLLTVYKMMEDREGLIIRNVNDTIMEVFASVGFTRFIKIE
ncbi:MAG: STAS domain-containing protein [Lachnospiraceae bacterium]|nr:STAS domain-containing protein [Lachnospiraceae bacterium]MBO6298897.1 STAS domain-containing protein [Lachnospiraceae bacterium]